MKRSVLWLICSVLWFTIGVSAQTPEWKGGSANADVSAGFTLEYVDEAYTLFNRFQ